MTDPTDGPPDPILVSRLVAALAEARGLTKGDLARLDDAGLAALRADALAARDRLPVPQDAPGFLFHGTARTRLAAIRRDGLAPQTRSRWATTPLVGDHGVGKVCLTRRVDRAEFYARAAAPRSPALLRVRETELADLHPDPKEQADCVYTTAAIAPGHLDLWSGRAWQPLVRARND